MVKWPQKWPALSHHEGPLLPERFFGCVEETAGEQRFRPMTIRLRGRECVGRRDDRKLEVQKIESSWHRAWTAGTARGCAGTGGCGPVVRIGAPGAPFRSQSLEQRPPGSPIRTQPGREPEGRHLSGIPGSGLLGWVRNGGGGAAANAIPPSHPAVAPQDRFRHSGQRRPELRSPAPRSSNLPTSCRPLPAPPG
jgi:hypothetical protein